LFAHLHCTFEQAIYILLSNASSTYSIFVGYIHEYGLYLQVKY